MNKAHPRYAHEYQSPQGRKYVRWEGKEIQLRIKQHINLMAEVKAGYVWDKVIMRIVVRKPAEKYMLSPEEREYWIRQYAKSIQECGGDLAGYIKRYGRKGDHNHYGEGGEAIYQADMAYFIGLLMGAI